MITPCFCAYLTVRYDATPFKYESAPKPGFQPNKTLINATSTKISGDAPSQLRPPYGERPRGPPVTGPSLLGQRLFEEINSAVDEGMKYQMFTPLATNSSAIAVARC